MRNNNIKNIQISPKSISAEKFVNKIKAFVDRNVWIIFIVILVAGLWLRFYRIEEFLNFGWDQARDAWITRDILMGKYTLIGPRTGIGHFHLGPLYFYLLAPFYYLSNYDPAASNYLNIILNIINFVILFIVTKKIFNNFAALFVTLIYATNSYLIGINQVPWNVTLMPGVAALIFYSIVKIYENKFKWFFVLSPLCGLYFHIHFTAIFLPVIILLSFIFLKNKILAIKYALLSLPFYLIWFIPNILYELQNRYANVFRMEDFLNNYFLGFHLRFLLHRIPEVLVQFSTILNYPKFSSTRIVVPLVFILLNIFFERDNKYKLLGYLLLLWFFVPLIGFTLYGGPISEYYLLYDVPIVLFMIVYLHMKLLQTRIKYALIPLMMVFWLLYIYQNTLSFSNRNYNNGLDSQKSAAKKTIREGGVIKYNEGDIQSYLYVIWKNENK